MEYIASSVANEAAQNLAKVFNYHPYGMFRYFWNFVGIDYEEYFKKKPLTSGWEIPEEAAW